MKKVLTSSPKMHQRTTCVIIVLYVFISACTSQRIDGRYLRPPSQERPCTTSGRCGDTEKSKEPYDDYKIPDKSDESYPAAERPSYRPKPDTDRYDGSRYGEKPATAVVDRPKDSGDDYRNVRLKPPIRDTYHPKPTRDDYAPKPAIGDDYVPKPTIRDDYGSKPPIRDDYGVKPPIRDDYGVKPPIRDDYGVKPPIRDDYGSKPPIRDDYGVKPPIRDDYGVKPPIRDDYAVKPPIRDDYDVKPPVRDDYGSKPPIRDDYGSKPPIRDDYGSKPPIRDDYGVKPPIRDDYGSRPVDSNVEKPKPGYRDDYVSRPSEHDSKPPRRDEYPSKPVSGSSGPYGQPGSRPIPSDYDKGRPSYPGDRDYKVGGGTGGFGGGKDDDSDAYKDDNLKDSETSGKPAAVKDDGNCICVPYYQCKEGHIVTDGSGIIDARRRKQPDELPLDGKFNPPSCGPFHVCCNTPETSTVKPYEHRCGVRNPSGINSRILSPSNQGEADFGEWPWQAAVLKTEGTVNIFQCGGVLIDKYHILTVAHCVFHLYKYDEYPLKIRLGEWDTQTTSEFLSHEDYNVSKIIIHPEYKNTSLWNDIALLRLRDPVLFAPHIDTVCLPKYDEIFAGQNCVVTGWGKDSYKGGTFSNVMKEVALQVVDNYNCEEMLRKTRLGRFFQLHEGFVCAGGEHGLDSCKGDGGGPLVCYRKDRSYALAGLVSWGIDCGQPGVPGVYVKVQKYLDWISKNTGIGLEDYWPKV